MGEGRLVPRRLARRCRRTPRGTGSAPVGVEVAVRGDEAMALAVALGHAARRVTAPNPWVGCLVVRDGVVVGEGATRPPGGPHAEVVALRAAADRARGATAYVTLEPCAHHGRTPPCADALLDAGVARVVVGVEDPDPDVAGQGIARLRAHGVDVEVGPGSDEVRRSLGPYLHHRRHGRAFCLVKTAVSLDGRVAAADGSTRWITAGEARADAHGLRADSQAVVVGSGTALADRPALTVRHAAVDRQPLRVLLDARGRVAADGPLFDPDLAATLVVTTDRAPRRAVEAWVAAGAKVETVAPGVDGGVDPRAVLELLGARGVLQAMVEGGPTLHAALLRAGLVDRIVAYVAPTFLGPDGWPALAGPGPATLARARRWHLAAVARLGDDVRLDLEPPDGPPDGDA